MDYSFVTRKFQRSIAGLGLIAVLATSAFAGTAFSMSFGDVDSDHFASASIEALSDDGVMTGYEDGTFGPDDTLTREQAAKILVEAFNLAVDADAEVTCTGEVSDWAESYMATANLHGVLEGEGDGSCNAQGNVNRAAFAKMVVNAAVLSNDGVMGSDLFDDVESSDWFDEFVGTAWTWSVVNGYENGDYGPGDDVLRGQAAYMTYAAMNPEYREPEVEEPEEPVEGGEGGDLEVILSPDSPEDYTYFSIGTNAEVAIFELTASDEDVLVTSFEVELASGDSASITGLALYDEDGTRVSKVDDTLDSDDMARMNLLEGGYTVEAGSSVEFHLVNSFDAAANTSTFYSYAFDATMVESNANSVEVEDDLVTGIFGLLDNDTGAVTVTDDDIAADVQVGETDAELFTFEVEETTSDKDVWMMGFTFENTGTANLDEAVDDLALYFDGDWVADGTQFGDYISFQMDEETAPLVEAGATESFEVRARIIGESSETLNFSIEETLDVRAVDEDDNDVAVTDSYTGAATTIEAGAISVVAYDAETDKFRADREDIELGRFEVTPGTDGMELISLDINVTLPNEEDDNAEVWYPSDLFENFKVELNGSTYNMDLATAGSSEDYTVDLDKTLVEGTVYEFVVYADTVTTTAAAATATASSRDGVTYDVDNYTNFSILMAIPDLANDVYVEETASGDQVTDFTPSAVSFNDLEGETAGVEINGLALSSAKSAVVGSTDVLIHEFEVEESADVSDVTIKDLGVYIQVDENDNGTYMEAGEEAEDANITSVDLYQVASDGTESLVDSISGGNISALVASEGNPVNFDFDDITVAQGDSETFRVYLSFVDDDTLSGDDFRAGVATYDIRDDENNEVYESGDADTDGDFYGADTPPTSSRTVSLVATGALYVEVDNDDNTYGTANKRFIQNGSEDVGVFTLALRSVNEDVTVDDYTLELSSSTGGTISQMFESFNIYDEDGVLIGTQTVTDETTTINFDNPATELIAYADVTTRYYFVADTTSYGLNEIGVSDTNTTANRTFNMFIVTGGATGEDSGNTLVNNDNSDGSYGSTLEAGEIGYGSTTAGTRAGDNYTTADDTSESEAFGMAATLISEVELVSSYSSYSVASSLTNGSNNVAILAVTVDDTVNSESTGDDVKVDLNVLVTQYTKLAGTTVNSTSIERIGGSEAAIAGVSTGDAVGDKATFTLTWTTDNLVVPGTTAYFLVKANVTKDATVDNDDFVQFALRDISSTNPGSVAYADNFNWNDFSSATPNIAVYMGGTTSIEGAKISE